jgi:excinuclease UvrABC ATPase subunit
MNIYQPYFYVIQELTTGMYYAGAKWGKDSNPKNFMKEDGYKTSSNIIKSAIEENGLSSFTVRKIKCFENVSACRDYETRFLKKVNAKDNCRFYNRHNNDNIFTYHDEKYKLKMIEIYGVEDPNHSKEIVQRIKDTNNERLGVDWPMMSEECKNKRVQTYMSKYGVENPMFSKEIKEKQKKNNIVKYGTENVFQVDFIKEKSKESLMKKYGVEHPMYSDEIKDQMKNTNLNKYGVENVFQSEEVKNKIKERVDYLLNRPQLNVLRKYQKMFNLKFGKGWVRKPNEFINQLLEDTISKYGEIDS